MEDRVKKLKRLTKAQTVFRKNKRQIGAVRLDIYISKEGYDKLVSLCAAEGCTQGGYIDRLLVKDGQQCEEVNDMGNANVYNQVNIEALTQQELINVIQRQQYWLNRLQKINDALMSR